MTVTVYTDASFNHVHKIAACGFFAFENDKPLKHEVVLVAPIKDSALAEVYAMTEGLQYAFMIKTVKHIVLYTDHLPTIERLQTRRGKSSARMKNLFDTIEMIRDWGITIRVAHVKAHSSCSQNNKVDKSCKEALRQYLKQNHASNQKRRHNSKNRR